MEPDKENRNPHESWTPRRRREKLTTRSQERRASFHRKGETPTSHPEHTDRLRDTGSDRHTPKANPTARTSIATPLARRTPAQTPLTPLRSIKEYRKRIASTNASYMDPPLTMYPRQKKPRLLDPTWSHTSDERQSEPPTMQPTPLISPSSAKTFQRNFTEAMELYETAHNTSTRGPSPAALREETCNSPSKRQRTPLESRSAAPAASHQPATTDTSPNRNKDHSQTKDSEQTRQTSLNCLLINARSVKKHKYEFRDTLESHNPDLAFITETWLNDHDEAPTLHEAIPPAYRTITANRSTHAGGLAIVHRASYKAHIQDTQKTTHFEHALFKVNVDQRNTLSFLLIYRRPKESISAFHAELADLITAIYNKNPNLTILGDFNNHFEKTLDLNTRKLNIYMNSLELKQIVKGRTQREGHTLDAIYAEPSTTSVIGSYPLYWTDHWIINFHIKLRQPKPVAKPNTCNTETTRSWGKMIQNPKVAAWFAEHLPQREQLEDPEAGPGRLDNCIRDAVALFAPTRPLQRKSNNVEGWYSTELKNIKREHRAMERKWRTNQDETTRLQLIKQRRRMNYMIKHKKKEHYTGRILKSKNPSKELFKIINEFKHPEAYDTPEIKSQEFCNKLSDHFQTKIQKYHHKIEASRKITKQEQKLPPSASLGQGAGGTPEDSDPDHLWSFKELTPSEFQKLVRDSRKSGSPEDPCPAHIMKELLLKIPELMEATRTVINCSLREGLVAVIRKRTIVKPLLKKTSLDPTNTDNYRPVSNNSYFAKLEERAVFLQLSAHVESHGWLDDQQVGFRKSRSTESATTSIWEDLKLHADKNDASVLILLDLSAAFDTVDHRILADRLETYGLKGKALEWISSFLNNRMQAIWTAPFKSDFKEVSYGVPQGASISPLLFNLYLRPLMDIIKSHGVTVYNYADDIQLVVHYKDPKTAAPPDTAGVMKAIENWMSDNHLVLNPGKTVIMATGNTRLVPPTIPWPASMDNPPPCAEDCINLGIAMDYKLLLKKHCSKVSRSCIYHIKLLRKILPFLAFPQKVTAAVAFILSRIDFGNSILLGTSKENLHTLQRVQNMAARLVLNLGPRDHISPALYNLHWLPIGRRISFKSLCITHRAIYNPPVEFIAKRFTLNNSNRPRRNGEGPILQVPRFNKLKMGGSSFTRLSSKIWNLLPGFIRSTEDHLKFRKLLKTWLFPTEMEGKEGTAETRIALLPNTGERRERLRRHEVEANRKTPTSQRTRPVSTTRSQPL